MRRYIAEVVEMMILLLCVLTNHAHGCWIINSSPLARLYRWALHDRWNDTGPDHETCPTCHFDRRAYIPDAQYQAKVDELEAEIDRLETPPSYGLTASRSAVAMYQYDARTGRTHRLA